MLGTLRKAFVCEMFVNWGSPARDQAQAKETGGEIDPENDPRRLRPGEIDPNPHTKVLFLLFF
jgi:hypothetical protein